MAWCNVQVQHLRVLAKLYSQLKRHERAAQVYELLATRHSGLGDAQVSLVLRVADYDNAIMQVCTPNFCCARLSYALTSSH